MIQTYIGIGSNLNQPLLQVRTAIDALAKLPTSKLLQTSSFYRSKPLGPCDQSDFINAVVCLNTCLSAQQLLTAMQRIESDQGRVRTTRWGPRTIDLDLLLYGDAVITTADLMIPHPGMKQREFVLYPLAEVAPDLILPTGESVTALKLRCLSKGIAKVVVSSNG